MNNLSLTPIDTKQDPYILVKMYYDHQYERIARLHGQRLRIAGFVMTLSILGFTWVFERGIDLNILNGILLPLIIISANFLSLVYILFTKQWSRIHRKRARQILVEYAPHIYSLQQKIGLPRQISWFSLAKTLYILHVLLSVISLAIIAAYWTGI